jgi:glycosyltransferase involved in cell wall biosynthesis
MNFLIVTYVEHTIKGNQYYAYAPYVLEMNIWSKFVNKLIIVAPISEGAITPIHSNYNHQNITFVPVSNFDILNYKSFFQTVYKLPKICFTIFQAMRMADHIHLRCPGNMGLLGSLLQILLPNKNKTAKYAGNWDFNAIKPFTYKLQQKILSSTFLSKNMKVLVYGEWENSSANIIPFFTATYHQSEYIDLFKTDFDSGVKFIFVGSLVKGKNPFYAIQIVEQLLKNGINAKLDLYGEGIERSNLENYIFKNELQKSVNLKGNQNQSILKKAYQESHFVILPSESEGWPKAIAEGMFWECVPLATKVSCVPYMLNWGERGIFLSMELKVDVRDIKSMLNNMLEFKLKSKKALDWSRNFTIDKFEMEIQKILKP